MDEQQLLISRRHAGCSCSPAAHPEHSLRSPGEADRYLSVINASPSHVFSLLCFGFLGHGQEHTSTAPAPRAAHPPGSRAPPRHHPKSSPPMWSWHKFRTPKPSSTTHSTLENQDRGCLEPPAPGYLPQRPASTVAVDEQREPWISASSWYPQTP